MDYHCNSILKIFILSMTLFVKVYGEMTIAGYKFEFVSSMYDPKFVACRGGAFAVYGEPLFAYREINENEKCPTSAYKVTYAQNEHHTYSAVHLCCIHDFPWRDVYSSNQSLSTLAWSEQTELLRKGFNHYVAEIEPKEKHDILALVGYGLFGATIAQAIICALVAFVFFGTRGKIILVAPQDGIRTVDERKMTTTSSYLDSAFTGGTTGNTLFNGSNDLRSATISTIHE